MTGTIDSQLEKTMPPIWRWGDPPEAIDACLKAGGVVAVPTESTYGLAVDPSSEKAVAAVMRCKRRPTDRPLPVLAGDIGELIRLGVRLDHPALQRAVAAWPAALTIVAPLTRPVAAALGAPTLAVRIPDHEPLRRLLDGLSRAVTATSANRSGEAAATTVRQVSALLAGERAIVIEDLEMPGGAPSTIVTLADGELVVLREGRFPVADLLGR